MPMQQVEFEFPDPEKDEKLQEVEVKEEEVVDTNIEVEDAVGRETIGKPNKKEAAEKSEVEIEVEDDTPPADRGRKPSEPPEEVTNEELENYSDKVKKRIQHFSKGYHDERRAKEQAVREREEAIAYAQKLIEQNQELNAKGAQNHNALIESAKKQVESELAVAQKQYKEAYEAGEPDAVLQAQTLLNAAQIRLDKVNGMKQREIPANNQTTLQNNENNVQSQQLAPEQPQRDEKAEAWRTKNPWFGSDDEMTSLAMGVHTRLAKQGVDLQSDEYYDAINARMREVFPDKFESTDKPEAEGSKKQSNVVAPATRSTAPKKVRLTQTQVQIAKKLGVPLELYAQKVAEEMRKT